MIGLGTIAEKGRGYVLCAFACRPSPRVCRKRRGILRHDQRIFGHACAQPNPTNPSHTQLCQHQLLNSSFSTHVPDLSQFATIILSTPVFSPFHGLVPTCPIIIISLPDL
jgi:hypothetical protein